jgi:hypothetical protein
VITGDLEDFHFARIDDMFEFFRKPVGYINEGYWAQKLCGPVRAKTFSPERFQQQVFEYFWEDRHDRPGPQAPLWRAICEEVLSEAENGEDASRSALDTFRYYYPSEPRPEPQPDAVREVQAPEPAKDFVPQRIPRRSPPSPRARRSADVFEFSDSWEWDLTDYDWHFRVSCHAIVWGINQYDKHRAAIQAAPGPVVT